MAAHHYAHRGPFDLNKKEKGEHEKPLDRLLGGLFSGKKRQRPKSPQPYLSRRHIPQTAMLHRGYVPVVRFNASSRAPARTMYRHDPEAAAKMARSYGSMAVWPNPEPGQHPKKKFGLNSLLDSNLIFGRSPKADEIRRKSRENSLFG